MPERPLVPQLTISNEIARLYKTRTGRGPRRVSTTITQDLVVCVLQDTHTLQEATILDAGAEDLVRDLRTRFQQHVGPDAVEIVQRATGRTVTGHVPGYSSALDTAVEVFLLDDPHAVAAPD